MTRAQELYEEWTEGESGMRPARIQEVRSDLVKATGLPIPRGRAEIESWLEAMKAQMTRKLKNAASEEESGSEAGDDEEDGEGEE